MAIRTKGKTKGCEEECLESLERLVETLVLQLDVDFLNNETTEKSNDAQGASAEISLREIQIGKVRTQCPILGISDNPV